jgi:hypothetical protein
MKLSDTFNYFTNQTVETLMLINFAKKPSMSRPVSAKSGSGRFNEMESRPVSALSRASRATSAMSTRRTETEVPRSAKTRSSLSSANPGSISGVIGRAQSASSTKATGHGTINQEQAHNQKHFEFQYAAPYTSLISQSHKTQTVRNNIDKYYIEQVITTCIARTEKIV